MILLVVKKYVYKKEKTSIKTKRLSPKQKKVLDYFGKIGKFSKDDGSGL